MCNFAAEKKVEGLNGRVVYRSNNNANANGGLVYSNANNASSNSNTNIGTRLTLRTKSASNGRKQSHHYEKDVTTSQGDGRYLVSFREKKTGEWAKFFTASEEMKQILDKVSDIEDGFPFETVIESEVFDGNKVKYSFT